MKKITITIQGMHCTSCASNIEKGLRRVSGVKSASVSLLLKKGVIECENNVSNEEIKNAVERVGYKVIKMEPE